MSGREWIVEAFGCEARRLCSMRALQTLFAAIIRDMSLNVVGQPQWHEFPTPGGITGVCILAESHLTVHTFPEHQSLCLNVFCCTPRDAWDFSAQLAEYVGATRVEVRVLEREYVQNISAIAPA
jgi:S-adenosylmethionine decarboxylase